MCFLSRYCVQDTPTGIGLSMQFKSLVPFCFSTCRSNKDLQFCDTVDSSFFKKIKIVSLLGCTRLHQISQGVRSQNFPILGLPPPCRRKLADPVRQRPAWGMLPAEKASALLRAPFAAEEIAAPANLHVMAQCTGDPCPRRSLASHMVWLAGR